MVAEEDNIDQPISETNDTQYIVSGKRSFEAAKDYVGKKIAVLNYANNLSIGGAPFYAGAQEESLCRCSTLLPCLRAMKASFYHKHHELYCTKQMDFMGNDDLIYTPEVVVFKTDERTEPVYPRMMPREEWFKVNVITCAAPQMQIAKRLPENYENVIRGRIRKILDVAAKEGNEVLILGAWGCGAFKNPVEVIARVFVELLKEYDFETVEFALATRNDVQSSAFARALREIGNK
jgi:uncharacterized protein (TIGR02452 family)